MAAPTSAPPLNDADVPFPPRFRGLKRYSIVFAIAIILLIGLRLWWGYEAHRRLDAEIAAAHARGEPIFLADFVTPAVADSENAALLLDSAGRKIRFTKEQNEWEASQRSGPLSPEDLRIIESILRDNAESLKLAREARSRSKFDWGVHPRSPFMNMLLPWLN